MTFSNVSFTYYNPFYNETSWTDGATMSGIFHMSGISLGLSKTRRYDPNTSAPGGAYVTWSAPFNFGSDRFILYTNSWLQGVSDNVVNGSYAEAYPVCFVSGSLGGGMTAAGFRNELYKLFYNQQTVGSPRDNGTVYPVVADPYTYGFETVISQFTDTNTNGYANNYLITSTVDGYEYPAIIKRIENKLILYYLFDFGWESSIGRSFHSNPQDLQPTNLANESKKVNLVGAANGLYFSDEKYGFATMSTASIQPYPDPVYFLSDNDFATTIQGKRSICLSFWFTFRNMAFMPTIQTIFNSTSNTGGLHFDQIKIQYNKDSGRMTTTIQTSNGTSDTFESTGLEISENVFMNYQISWDSGTNKFISYKNKVQDLNANINNTANQNFASDGSGKFAVGVKLNSNNEVVIDEEAARWMILGSFFIWAGDENVSFTDDEMLQNFYVMKQRYGV